MRSRRSASILYPGRDIPDSPPRQVTATTLSNSDFAIRRPRAHREPKLRPPGRSGLPTSQPFPAKRRRTGLALASRIQFTLRPEMPHFPLFLLSKQKMASLCEAGHFTFYYLTIFRTALTPYREPLPVP